MAAIAGKCAGEPTPSAVKELIRRKWPEALLENAGRSGRSFVTGLENFDRLFPSGGIPYGQLVEITGGASCGKTGLLFHVLAGLVRQVRVGYVDAGNTFFPGAASAW